MAICADRLQTIGKLCATADAAISNKSKEIDVARRLPAHLVAHLEAVSPQLRQFSQAMTRPGAAADAGEDENQEGSTR